ncbi:MAG: site-specific DNA-methyltransferase, partial [Deltaproteobacteria bacterium]|nr:site-specific DNA-methyltransferase [Deltaproteobacteria bacterium]
HAVMSLNNEDGGKRKFVLIEMANYFDTVMIPRIKKVAYSFNWKDGEPKDSGGNGVLFKYQVLEQYEDTLDNLELKENKEALSLFGSDYLLKYFLDFESRDNAALVNLEHFKKPFSYKLKVNFEEVGEPQEVIVDLPETFHYLIGLTVKKIKIRKEKGKKYLFSLGEKESRSIALVWREYDDKWTKTSFKRDKDFIIQEIGDWAPQVIYVNGQSTLTPKIGGQTVEIRAIEPEFRKRMVNAS